MVANTYYSNPMNEPFLDPHPYRSIVGGLQYLKFTRHYSLALLTPQWEKLLEPTGGLLTWSSQTYQPIKT